MESIYKEKAKNKQTGEIVRYSIYNDKPDRVFVYSKGRSRYGWWVNLEYFKAQYEPLTIKSEQQKWEEAYKKIIKRTSASGLWANLKLRAEEFLKYGYDVWKQIKTLARNTEYGGLDDYCIQKVGMKHYQIEDKELALKLSLEFYRNLYGNLIDKYPVYFSNNGSINIEEHEWGIPKFKSMNFGKSNKYYKDCIAKALANNTNYSTGRTDKFDETSYDVSFSYNSETQKAWYSEEYRGTGNGHYYLALDGSCALFYEND